MFKTIFGKKGYTLFGLYSDQIKASLNGNINKHTLVWSMSSGNLLITKIVRNNSNHAEQYFKNLKEKKGYEVCLEVLSLF